MKTFLALLFAFGLLLPAVSVGEIVNTPINPKQYDHVIRVACVGDSITAGVGTNRGPLTSWDGVMGRMFDAKSKGKWIVNNFGLSGRTVLKRGDVPYLTHGAMKEALASKPDVVVVMLGTNDTKPQNWRLKDALIDDYKELIGQFKALPGHPRIFICTPPFVVGAGISGINEADIVEELPMLKKVAADEDAGLIDVHSATIDSKDIPDTVHPNNKGAIVIAKTVYKALTGEAYTGDPPPPPPKPASTRATTAPDKGR